LNLPDLWAKVVIEEDFSGSVRFGRTPAASLFGVNAFDQPDVEGGKQTTYGLMGRRGFQSYQRQFTEASPALDKYRIVG
jgi:hypothetical protein